MNKNCNDSDKASIFVLRISACLTALILAGPACVMAQPITAPTLSTPSAEPGLVSGQGLGLRLGYNTNYKKATLVYETPALWSYQFQNGWGRLGVDIELGASYWKASKHRQPESMWQLSAIPMVRWWPNNSFYLEGGFGPTVLSRSEFAGRNLGTRMQFGTHLGVGTLINKVHRVGLRASHYSNANIKKPNPGLDLIELTYTYQF